MSKYRAVSLFSGGLDSILAAKIMQEQGWEVIGLHFVSPFFGHPELVRDWEETYGLPIRTVDVSPEYIQMFLQGPAHGLGKFLNPCIDCKIFMLQQARKYMYELDACLVISGEVLGQRPMSQRKNPLFLIRSRADVREILLRPLSAGLLPPTHAEKQGWVDREKLFSISGRGRKDQLALAGKFGIEEIPTPGGGCLLTQEHSAQRYLPLLGNKGIRTPEVRDFYLANRGRQYWSGNYWLSIGRNKEDNEQLFECSTEEDYLFTLKQFPGPLAVGRPMSGKWPMEVVQSAAAFMSSFAPKARKSLRAVEVEIRRGDEVDCLPVWPGDTGAVQWAEPQWDAERKHRFAGRIEDVHAV